jgi:hypothetical protein
MYSKEQLIEFANYCISNIASDKSQETIFQEWDAENPYNKTRKHFVIHLSKLKSPYAEQAIANYNDEFARRVNINSVKDVQEALKYAFDWLASPEAADYWSDIYDNIDKYSK